MCDVFMYAQVCVLERVCWARGGLQVSFLSPFPSCFTGAHWLARRLSVSLQGSSCLCLRCIRTAEGRCHALFFIRGWSLSLGLYVCATSALFAEKFPQPPVQLKKIFQAVLETKKRACTFMDSDEMAQCNQIFFFYICFYFLGYSENITLSPFIQI